MYKRIMGVNVMERKHAVIALQAIRGIGLCTAKKICEETNIAPDRKISTLSESELDCLRKEVGNHEDSLEGNLQRERDTAIKRKRDMGCYQGMRHRRSLPVRGQRTKTNARTRKSKSKKQK